LQDSISDRLARNLLLQLQERPATAVVRRITDNNAAYESYLTGLYFWNRRNRENLTKAISYFEQAVATDPNFALAHSLLADCYYLDADAHMGIYQGGDTLKRVNEETARALELDNNLAEAHTVRAGLALIDNDPATADLEFRLALELNPNYAVAHLRYGYFLFSMQRLHEANTQMAQARQLDPASPITNAARGFMLYMSRDYDSAIDCFRKAIELQPESEAARFNLGLTYVTKGMFKEGLEEFQRLESTDDMRAAQGKIWVYGQQGRKLDAQKLVTRLEQAKDEWAMMPIDYVFMYAAVGDKDKAFAWLEKVNLRGMTAARLKFEPQLDVLRADVRFAQYLSRHQSELLPPQLSSWRSGFYWVYGRVHNDLSKPRPCRAQSPGWRRLNISVLAGKSG
jgi:tetratricopeptide (TPR) repeat protein